MDAFCKIWAFVKAAVSSAKFASSIFDNEAWALTAILLKLSIVDCNLLLAAPIEDLISEIIASPPSITANAFVAPVLVTRDTLEIDANADEISAVFAENALSAWPGVTVNAWWLDSVTWPSKAPLSVPLFVRVILLPTVSSLSIVVKVAFPPAISPIIIS